MNHPANGQAPSLLPRGSESMSDARERALNEAAGTGMVAIYNAEGGVKNWLSARMDQLTLSKNALPVLGAIAISALAIAKPEAFKPVVQVGTDVAAQVEHAVAKLIPDEHPPTMQDTP